MFRLIIILGLLLQTSLSFAQTLTGDENNREEITLKMRHLQAQINSLDAQRELMQINTSYLGALGTSLSTTANDILKLLGIGLPEHRQGISAVRALGRQITELAQKNDPTMLERANQVRNNCATCHANSHPAGGINWEFIFKYDWNTIVAKCNEAGKNPYLCRSMNGMLSAYGYLLTAYNAKVQDFEMTALVSDELTRILVDLKTKNFRHLPEELRLGAENNAREMSRLAIAKDPEVFKKIPTATTACTTCHNQMLFSSIVSKTNPNLAALKSPFSNLKF